MALGRVCHLKMYGACGYALWDKPNRHAGKPIEFLVKPLNFLNKVKRLTD